MSEPKPMTEPINTVDEILAKAMFGVSELKPEELELFKKAFPEIRKRATNAINSLIIQARKDELQNTYTYNNSVEIYSYYAKDAGTKEDRIAALESQLGKK